MDLTDELRAEYARAWERCAISPGWLVRVGVLADRAVVGRARFQPVADKYGIPWWWLAGVQAMEANGLFTRHFHNGDPLTQRTVNVPNGRPARTPPPYSWEESVVDAIEWWQGGLLMGWDEWTVVGALYLWERWNGFGYRERGAASAYVWSGTNMYLAGAFVLDHGWVPNAVSGQVGTAAILRLLVGRRVVKLEGDDLPVDDGDDEDGRVPG